MVHIENRTPSPAWVSKEQKVKKCPDDFISKKTVSEVTDLFCSETTTHGINHAWNNRTNFLGIVWLVITLTFFILLGYTTFGLFVEFGQRDIQSQTKAVLGGGKGLQLPSVAVCNRGIFSKRKLQALNISDEVANYLMAMIQVPAGVNISLLSTKASLEFLQEAHKDLLHILQRTNFTQKQLIEAVSYTCEDLLTHCFMGPIHMERSTCCSGFQGIPTMLGLCHVHYTSAELTQSFEGEYMGVTLFFALPSDDSPVVLSHVFDRTQMMKSGIQVSFFSNQTHPTFAVVGQSVPIIAGTQTGITLALSLVRDVGMKTLFDWDIVPCVPDQDINYFGNLEEFFVTNPNCVLGHIRNRFRQFSNCPMYNLEINLDGEHRVCPLQELHRSYVNSMATLGLSHMIGEHSNFSTNETENPDNTCLEPCVRYDYSYTSNSITIKDDDYHHLKEEFQVPEGKDIAIIKAYFPHLRYTETLLKRMDLSEFISTLGGYMGVFLGCSLVTATELFVFLGLFIAIFIRRLKTKFSGSSRRC